MVAASFMRAKARGGQLWSEMRFIHFYDKKICCEGELWPRKMQECRYWFYGKKNMM